MKAKISLTALLAAMALATASHAGENEEQIPWADVPGAVQKTITDHAGDGKVEEVEKQTEGGKTVYEAKIKKPDGTEVEIEVGEDGKLIATEEED